MCSFQHIMCSQLSQCWIEVLDGEMEHTMNIMLCYLLLITCSSATKLSQDLAQIIFIHLALVGVISDYIVLVVTTYHPDKDRLLCHASLQNDGRVQGKLHYEVDKCDSVVRTQYVLPVTSPVSHLTQTSFTTQSAQDVLAQVSTTIAPSEQVAPQRTTSAPSELVAPERTMSAPADDGAIDKVAIEVDGDDSPLSSTSLEEQIATLLFPSSLSSSSAATGGNASSSSASRPDETRVSPRLEDGLGGFHHP